MVKTTILRAVFLVIALVGCVGSLQAAACAITTLDVVLTPGFTCDQTDKLFSDFEYTGTTAASAIGVNFLEGVDTLGRDTHTVSFQSGGFGAITNLSYTVSVIAGPKVIVGSGLGTYRPFGTGGTVLTNWTPPNVTLKSTPADPDPASAFYAGISATDVTNTYDGVAGLQIINNTVTQSVIPEPATYGLLGSALLAIGLLRRRR